MKVSANFAALQRTKWYEYALRFLAGGLVTVATGLIAKRFGPEFGGLFLAFPAIFPASATLVEKHEVEKKRRAGIPKTARGRQAAALDSRGASLGSIGLAAFAFTVWKLLPDHGAVAVIVGAAAVWLSTSVALWLILKTHWRKRKAS